MDFSKKSSPNYDSRFVNALPSENETTSYSKDFTLSEDFMRGLKIGSPIDNIINSFNQQDFFAKSIKVPSPHFFKFSPRTL